MRSLTIVLLMALALLVGPWPASAQDSCEVAGVRLTSCAVEAQAFHSVVLAIPGWNGRCDDTFGVGDRNMLNVVRGISFFDVDCFQFEPAEISFETIKGQLQDHLDLLRRQGYSEIAFITHSTGGIIVSDLVLSQALGDDGRPRLGDDKIGLFGDDGLTMRGLYAWAVPLNGVTRDVDIIAAVARLNPHLLPQMSADAEYIKKLQRGWKALADALAGLPNQDRARYDFPFLILQGQQGDLVVNPINTTDQWFPRGWATLIPDHAFHSDMVSAAGTRDVPRYPGVVMTDALLQSLPFTPRYEEIFGPAAPNTDLTLQKQLTVLKAVLGLAEHYNVFATVRPHIADFVVRLLDGGYPHDSRFDARAMAAIAELLDETIGRQGKPAVVEFGDDLLTTINRAFPANYSKQNTRAFGGGTAHAVRALATSIDRVAVRVLELIRQQPTLASSLRSSSGSLEVFQEKYLAITGRLLTVNDDPTRIQIIASLQSVLPAISPDTLLTSDAVAFLVDYTRGKPATHLQIGEMLFGIQKASPALNIQVIEAVLPALGSRPRGGEALWQTVFTDEQVRALVAAGLAQNPESAQVAQLIGEIIARGSVDRSNARLGLAVLQDLTALYGGQGSSLPQALVDEVELGVADTGFVGLKEAGAKLLTQTVAVQAE